MLVEDVLRAAKIAAVLIIFPNKTILIQAGIFGLILLTKILQQMNSRGL